ncbi:MAG: hypothetical protein ACREV5_22480 [Steroidobacter sp.]
MSAARPRRISTLLCIGCAPMTLALFAVQAGADHMTEAVWKVQEVTFGYLAGDSSYTCAGLRARLRSILTHLGAHEGMTIILRGCDQPNSNVSASITLTSPVEATSVNIDQLTRRDSRSELTARVRGVTLARAEDLPRFPAVWKTISFANAMHLRLSPADCDLLKQLRREILPRLAIRVIEDEIRCSTALRGVTRPRLTVAALIAAHKSP